MNHLKTTQIARYRDENTPSVCPILGIKPKRFVLDHDHKTGHCRAIISDEANRFLGVIENFYGSFLQNKTHFGLADLLSNCSKYVGNQYNSNPLHPVGIKQLVSAYRYYESDKQKSILLRNGIEPESDCGGRCKQYEQLLKS
jgi:hypothetical protein